MQYIITKLMKRFGGFPNPWYFCWCISWFTKAWSWLFAYTQSRCDICIPPHIRSFQHMIRTLTRWLVKIDPREFPWQTGAFVSGSSWTLLAFHAFYSKERQRDIESGQWKSNKRHGLRSWQLIMLKYWKHWSTEWRKIVLLRKIVLFIHQTILLCIFLGMIMLDWVTQSVIPCTRRGNKLVGGSHKGVKIWTLRRHYHRWKSLRNM